MAKNTKPSSSQKPSKNMMRGDGGKRMPARAGRPVPAMAKKDSGGGRKSSGRKGK